MRIKTITIDKKRLKVKANSASQEDGAGGIGKKLHKLQQLNYSKLYREYEMLKIMHNMGLPIKFENFDGLTYRFISGNKSVIINQKDLGVHKIVNVDTMVRTHGVGPATLSEFLDVNGAMEVNAQGNPVPTDEKAYRSGANARLTGKKKSVYKQVGPRGFWQLVETGTGSN